MLIVTGFLQLLLRMALIEAIVPGSGTLRILVWSVGGANILTQFGHSPLGKAHFAALSEGGGVLVGLELGVVVGELVEEDGDGQAVEDDSKGDANEGKEAAQHCLRVHVSITHGGYAYLKWTTNNHRDMNFQGLNLELNNGES